MKKAFLVTAAMALASCANSEPEATDANPKIETEFSEPAERFAVANIEAAKVLLKKEPKIIDLVHQDSALGVDWTIGVKDDGTSRIGYATYVCMVLSEQKVVDRFTDVRIVDYTRFMANGGDARSASLGHISCADYSIMGV